MLRIRSVLAALAAVLLASSSLAVAAESPTLTAEERAQFDRWLVESEETFLALIEGAEGEAWSWKPAPERWSVAECAEHIVKTEAALLSTGREALAGEPDPEWESKTAGKADFIAQVMPDRTGRAQAPQEVRPQGGVSKEELIATFRAQRAELAALIADEALELKRYTQEHPFPVFGTLNAHQWLIYVPLHTIRHSKQIREVQETPGYPG
ncbi:MAG TPA: DinB family protein [Thermoanaerobaculia bacterium]|nr:DinB family protein [Thermoanaerobaculia bacterium]